MYEKIELERRHELFTQIVRLQIQDRMTAWRIQIEKTTNRENSYDQVMEKQFLMC